MVVVVLVAGVRVVVLGLVVSAVVNVHQLWLVVEAQVSQRGALAQVQRDADAGQLWHEQRQHLGLDQRDGDRQRQRQGNRYEKFAAHVHTEKQRHVTHARTHGVYTLASAVGTDR